KLVTYGIACPSVYSSTARSKSACSAGGSPISQGISRSSCRTSYILTQLRLRAAFAVATLPASRHGRSGCDTGPANFVQGGRREDHPIQGLVLLGVVQFVNRRQQLRDLVAEFRAQGVLDQLEHPFPLDARDVRHFPSLLVLLQLLPEVLLQPRRQLHQPV